MTTRTVDFNKLTHLGEFIPSKSDVKLETIEDIRTYSLPRHNYSSFFLFKVRSTSQSEKKFRNFSTNFI